MYHLFDKMTFNTSDFCHHDNQGNSSNQGMLLLFHCQGLWIDPVNKAISNQTKIRRFHFCCEKPKSFLPTKCKKEHIHLQLIYSWYPNTGSKNRLVRYSNLKSVSGCRMVQISKMASILSGIQMVNYVNITGLWYWLFFPRQDWMRFHICSIHCISGCSSYGEDC